MLRGFLSEGLPLYRGGGAFPPTHQRFVDIGSNLLDEMYTGLYHDKQRHEGDLSAVLDRAKSCGVQRVICTAGTTTDSRRAFQLARQFPELLYSTAGVHPTQCAAFADGAGEDVIRALADLIQEGNGSESTGERRIVAIGECGLDYARLEFCPRELQLEGFNKQLDLASTLDLPMFLHNRDTEGEFLRIVTENFHKLRGGGVVHSFDGSMEEMRALTDLGLFIGINGCSLRSEESLRVAAAVPEHLLLLETDAPWCGIKPTHPSHPHVETIFPSKKKEKFELGFLVKDRNEPCTIRQVHEVLAAIRGVDPDTLAETILANTKRLFRIHIGSEE